MHAITINNIRVMAADETSASTIEREAKTLVEARDAAVASNGIVQAKLDAAEAGLKSAKDSATKAATDHEAKVKELEGRVPTQEAFDAAVEELLTVRTDALVILGKDADLKGKTVAQIRVAALEHAVANDEAAKALVTKMLKGADLAKANGDVVGYAFDSIVATAIAAGDGSKGTSGSAGAFAPVKRVGDASTGHGAPRVIKYGNTAHTGGTTGGRA